MSDGKRLMTIGETAKALGITRRMILNYEDRGLVTPDVREGEGGNRYYTPDTITRIRTIRVFQNMGITLDEIRGYFDDSTDLSPLIARLETMRDELNLNIEKLCERMRPSDAGKICFVTLPRQTVYRRTFRAPTVDIRKEQLRDIVPAAMRAYGTDTSRRMYFIEYPLDDPDLISYCIAVPEGSSGEFVAELPQAQAMCIYHHGSYESIPSVVKKLTESARAGDIRLCGSCRHIYLEGPPHHKDPSQFITQVALITAQAARF